MGITHTFTSTKSDGGDATLVKPSNWNATHAVDSVAPSGLTGATAASRYVGATTSGAPTAGTFAIGDFVIDQTGRIWVCTTAGTPGNWVIAGSGGTVFPESLVPEMWADSWGGFTASASESYSGGSSPWNAFTGSPGLSVSHGWLTNASALPQWIRIQIPSPVVATFYAIMPWWVDNYPSRTPQTWTFEGSNNGTSWTVLDTRTNFTTWTGSTYFNIFGFTNTVAYSYYRLNISANQGNAYTGIGGLRIYGPVTGTGTNGLANADIGALQMLARPSVITTEDDSFDSGSLNSKWSYYASSGATFSIPGWVTLPSGASIVQATPGGAFSIETEVSLSRSGAAEYQDVGLILTSGASQASSTDMRLGIGMSNSYTSMRIVFEKFVNGAFSSAYRADVATSPPVDQRLFLKLALDGSGNATPFWSQDGRQWVQINAAVAIGFTVSKIGLVNGSTSDALFGHFSRYASAPTFPLVASGASAAPPAVNAAGYLYLYTNFR